MLNFWPVALASLAWLVLMFGIALYGERRPAVKKNNKKKKKKQ